MKKERNRGGTIRDRTLEIKETKEDILIVICYYERAQMDEAVTLRVTLAQPLT
jgi:hypothetical protein